ncbi:MAG: tRNA uridine-5-carboxymethylaminomethyl(34) synthesis GTPase MnmE [Candidatus Eremiobacteraeota bacterium]|nr:tRNA uridine-5-carboxymethylaminomethyl(34) synthesis GTPase MnmE [Candidatus Eremiobacteraeota bacterium]
MATPPGLGGVAIVRVSGPRARGLLNSIFAPYSSQAEFESHKMVFGRVFDPVQDRPVDEALAVFMQAPRSYTCEDVVEFHTHGGSLVCEEVLRLCLAGGARLAAPGEFTQRAFLNGRLDLAQAESVAEVIGSRTRASLRLASGNLLGRLSELVGGLRQDVLNWMSLLEAEIDFGDEVPELSATENLQRLQALQTRVAQLIAQAEVGRLTHRGVEVVLVGPPNAGKSTLLNALLGEDRALVTDIPGTTRDRLEHSVVLSGMRLNLSDTAGLRDQTQDRVEQLGMERSRQALTEADLGILVVDCHQDWPGQLAEEVLAAGPACWLVVLNKQDLGARVQAAEVLERYPQVVVVEASLLREGAAGVEAALLEQARVLTGQQVECFSVNQRHYQALVRTRESLERVGLAVEDGLSGEFLCLDLRAAAGALGEIVGIDVSEEVLDRIFSTFCLGK